MYDADTRASAFLRSYAEEFDSVEIDSTFYGIPDRERCVRWARSVPASFRFALKLTREITHDRKLFASGALVREFFTNVAGLGDRLGAVLVQLPPAFTPDDRRALDAFLPELPRDVRCAIEFRDPRWYEPPLFDEIAVQLRERNIALALADAPFIALPLLLARVAQPTADFHYLRWIGVIDAIPTVDHMVIDRSEDLARWADALRGCSATMLFGYANNNYEGHAPATIRRLFALLDVDHTPPRRIRQTSLF